MIKIRNTNIPASYLMLFRDNKILLLRRFNTGYKDGKYSLVAGHVDNGESFTQCIIREAKEEAGIILIPQDLRVITVMHRITDEKVNNQRVDVFFVAEKWSGKIKNMEPHKCDDLSWFDLDSLPIDIIPYVKQAIDSFKNKIFYNEYGWD